MRHPYEADPPTDAHACERLLHRLLGADGLQHAVRELAAEQFPNPLRAGLTALGDDVRRAEFHGKPLAVFVPRHRDDALRARSLGGQHPAQPDGSVADDRHRRAWRDAGTQRRREGRWTSHR